MPGKDYGRDSLGNSWGKDNVNSSKGFHGYDKGYRTYRGSGKFKGSQCTYDECGNLVDSGPEMGTYDYSEPGTPSHVMNDVYPHLFNSSYEPGLTETY